MAKKYAINPNGEITQEGKGIGWISGGALALNEGIELTAAAMTYLKALAFDFRERNSVSPDAPAGTAEVMQASLPRMTDEPEFGLPPEHQPHAHEIPPAPPQDPYLGDKTPVYMHWFKLYHSEAEFNAKYLGRKTPVTDHRGVPIGPDIPESSIVTEPAEVWVKR